MQHHRMRQPRKPRLSPLIAVFGVAAVTAGVVGTTAPTLQAGSGQGNANADRYTGVLPGETTTTITTPTMVSVPVEKLPVVPVVPSTTMSPTTTTTEAPTRAARVHAQSTTTSSSTPSSTGAPPSRTTTTLPEAITAAPAAPVASTPYPVGTVDASEPSGFAPPGADALAGYTENYVTDFPGTSLPSGWTEYSGVPGGDPGAEFDPAHDVVSGGLLELNAYQDPAYGNEWVTGGVGQFAQTQTYGAYFVRSRVTGAGPAAVELLWPANGSWPPEIDFNETTGVDDATTATVHWSAANDQDERTLNIDMTQWHTWGVIWTPTSITYTVDGQVWGSVSEASEIPNIAMWIAIQEQTWCASGWACPSTPESMDVDWVAEYAPS